ncbi:MAG: hypothetical protein WAK75_04970 [Methanoregula sp.]|uniref:hypothetical protein n=1 Tax=Methanoregula sp. TaxID=2052170 RepID=UPI003BAFCD49
MSEIKDLKVSAEVYRLLVERKNVTRARDIDDVLRSMLGLPPTHPPVKQNSDEPGQHADTVQQNNERDSVASRPAASKVAFPVKVPSRFIGWTKAERDAFVLTGQVPQRIERPPGAEIDGVTT